MSLRKHLHIKLIPLTEKDDTAVLDIPVVGCTAPTVRTLCAQRRALPALGDSDAAI